MNISIFYGVGMSDVNINDIGLFATAFQVTANISGVDVLHNASPFSKGAYNGAESNSLEAT